MKHLAAWLIVLAAFTAALAVDFSVGRLVTLEIEYPLEDITPGTVIFVHASPDLTAPLLSWPIVAVIPATRTNRCPVTLELPRRFFVARASNEWGEGDFSEVLPSSPPRQDLKVRIR